tara:strand:+ start:694 stop:1263 length:570 start_codon:yes stop_codon:yes gene_type:complete
MSSPKGNFIEQYDDIISVDECNALISLFQQDNRCHPGMVGDMGRIDKSVKDSMDLTVKFDDQEEYNTIIRTPLTDAINQYVSKYYYLNDLSAWTLNNGYNVQAYKEGGGFGLLHCEKQGKSNFTTDRLLAWMIYLNDAKSGTDFPYQGVTLQPKAGRCCIWPAYWTHPHRGVVPNRGLKVIATGWCCFS